MARPLRIAWIGAGPAAREGTGGAPGVAIELLDGLARRGHTIDCFFPGKGHPLPPRLAGKDNLTFIWGTSDWRWRRWYNRTMIGVFVTGLFSRARASLRLRREVVRRHRRQPYDLVFQFSNIEALAMPASLARSVPLVIHPATHIAGELRFLLAERKLSLRCQPAYTFATAASVMAARVLVQRVRIRRARLVICISSVFRDHLVHDYGVPLEDTVVIPNPVAVERFAAADTTRPLEAPPRVLVLGRVSARKGVEDVVAVAKMLLTRDVEARVRVVGGATLWSDYRKLLEDLPSANSEYVGSIPAAEVPAELAHSDVLLQASKFEPFALTVAEALASGVPVVATTEVGAVEDVDRALAAAVAPGDVEGMTDAIVAMLERLREAPGQTRARARAEAQRLWASELVCDRVSAALEAVVADG
ncbi:MAG TPA: glycosyltransferase family 4 protein [Solirubrobacteraceae bacterium]|jgi:glycosyltransferase involved in cell wall biosynthesis|nr:glycosyltransferase family 4 protein [Solirubrobacteraceae bacterium]